jgi:hypothetical protein
MLSLGMFFLRIPPAKSTNLPLSRKSNDMFTTETQSTQRNEFEEKCFIQSVSPDWIKDPQLSVIVVKKEVEMKIYEMRIT